MQKSTFYVPKGWYLLLLLFMLLGFSSVQAQEIAVKGIVTSRADGTSIPGITVIVKGTTVGVSTDANGKFTINAKVGAVLSFQAVGYQTSEATVTGTTLNIALEIKSNTLNDVVVIGYGTTTRANITTAVAKIDPKNVPSSANNSVEELLVGRAPGLDVQQSSSQPGGAINLSIRGRGAPLIVVDGVIFPNSGLEPGNGSIAEGTNGVNRGALQGIAPGDIESIEVLKDASAAIYGVNAANGVILVTTKKGKSGRMNVDLSLNHSVVSNGPYLDPLNATQYETTYDVFTKDQYLKANGMFPYGSATPANLPAPLYSQDQIAAAGNGTDWLKQVLRTGYIDNDNLAISGGSDKTTYYFSGGYFNQIGTVQQAALTKYNGRANLNFKLTSWFTLNTDFTGSDNLYHNSSTGGQNDGSGNQGFGILQAALGYPANVPVYNSTGGYSQFANISNPVSLEQIQDHTYYHSLSSNVSADFKIIPGALTGKLLYGDNYEESRRDFFVPSTVFYYLQNLSRASLNYSTRENQTYEASLNFKKDVAKFLNIDLIGGTGQYISTYDGFGSQGTGGADGIGPTNLSSETGNLGISSYKGSTTTRSFFGRGSFDFLNRYLLSVSVRDDGYSLFFPQYKYALFPSASIGWKINDEPFFKDVEVIDQLKLRASIGETGATIGAAAYGGFSPSGDNIYFNSGSTEYVNITRYAIDNPKLTWQKTISKNLGLDFGILKDKITGSVDVYRDDITNLLSTSAPTAPLSPFSQQSVNGAHEVRTGYDIGIYTHNVTTSDFDWSTTINLDHYLFRYEHQFAFTTLQPYQSETDPVDEFYYFKTNGIIKPGQTVPAYQPTTGGANLPGAPLYVDKNGDGKLDYKDVYKLDQDPKINIGFGNTFRYKQLDLTVFFYGQFGGHANNYNNQWGNAFNLVSNGQGGTTQVLNAFSSSNLNGTLPSVNYSESAVGLIVPSDVNETSTNFVRLRNLTLGYTFNSAFINKFAKSLKVFVDGQDLFIITKFKGGDPEVTYYGIKGGYAPYPPTRTISFGIRAGF